MEFEQEPQGQVSWALDKLTDSLTQPNAKYWGNIHQDSRSNLAVVFGYLVPLMIFSNGLQIYLQARIMGTGPALFWVANLISVIIFISFILGGLCNAVAPRFGGISRGSASFKLFAFLQTPVLIGMLLRTIFLLIGAPGLGTFVETAGLLYGIFLLWVAIPAFYGLNEKGRFLAFALTTFMSWFILYVLLQYAFVAVGVSLWGQNPIGDAKKEGYELRFRLEEKRGQHEDRTYQLVLTEGSTYRFIFLSQHSFSNMDVVLSNASGELVVQDDPLDQDGTTQIDYAPDKTGVYYLTTKVGNIGGATKETKVALHAFWKGGDENYINTNPTPPVEVDGPPTEQPATEAVEPTPEATTTPQENP